MSVDTRNKRASCLSLGLAIARVFANPDGAIDTAAERQQAAYLYSGIDAGVSVPEYGTATASVSQRYTATASVTQRYTATASVAQRYTVTASVGLSAEVD